MSTHSVRSPVSVGLLLFSTVEGLDFAGPYEVFANAGEERGQAYCQVVTIGTAREIRRRGGLRVLANHLLLGVSTPRRVACPRWPKCS